jgi:hypothetical protein
VQQFFFYPEPIAAHQTGSATLIEPPPAVSEDISIRQLFMATQKGKLQKTTQTAMAKSDDDARLIFWMTKMQKFYNILL